MTPKDQPVDERLAHVLENILGQNYVDEYSGSDRHIGVDEIATQLLPVIQAECNRARKEGRMQMGEKIKQYSERADFFKPETQVVHTDTMVWLSGLDEEEKS